MLRELSELIIDVETGLDRFAAAASDRGVPITLTTVELVLPLDLRSVFRAGGCALLADVPRNRSDAGFSTIRSSLALSLVAVPADDPAEMQP